MNEQEVIKALNDINDQSALLDKDAREAFVHEKRTAVLTSAGYATETGFDVPFNVALAIF